MWTALPKASETRSTDAAGRSVRIRIRKFRVSSIDVKMLPVGDCTDGHRIVRFRQNIVRFYGVRTCDSSANAEALV